MGWGGEWGGGCGGGVMKQAWPTSPKDPCISGATRPGQRHLYVLPTRSSLPLQRHGCSHTCEPQQTIQKPPHKTHQLGTANKQYKTATQSTPTWDCALRDISAACSFISLSASRSVIASVPICICVRAQRMGSGFFSRVWGMLETPSLPLCHQQEPGRQ